MLITFEGIDGSGKTTQAIHLKIYLESIGKKVILTSEPTNNIIGKEIKKYIKKPRAAWIEAVLFSADRALHCEQEIIPNLDKIVICDRYIHSTIAYQTAMGVSRKWTKALNENAPKPDITFYLDVKPENAINRLIHRNTHTKYENLETLKKVRAEYITIKDKTFKKINGEKSIIETADEIRNIINKMIARKNIKH